VVGSAAYEFNWHPGHVLQMRRHVADPFSARERVAITALPKEMQDAEL